jgi:MFS family permease
MPAPDQRVFTSRFLLMCAFTFTVFLSAFQLFPTAPFRILDLGGSTFAAGLFLGLLTYAAAFSAPFTGALSDRIGQRRVLIVCSLVVAIFHASYAVVPSYRVMLVMVVLHGVFWSGLMSSSGAYMTSLLPVERRGEGISYWGLATVAAIAVAPSIGFWLYGFGWGWLCAVACALNLVMAGLAWSLEDLDRRQADAGTPAGVLEWRVLAVSLSLFLYSFGYGGITSFTGIYADELGIRPTGLYLTTLAVTILVTRPFFGSLGDRLGHTRVFAPCLTLICLGLLLLAFVETWWGFVVSAVTFGTGFGTAYPAFAAYVMSHVTAHRRGAAYGAMLAAFDTGIGTGSTTIGWLVQHYGFRVAFGVAAGLAALALPYFIAADRRFMQDRATGEVPL